MNNRYFFGGIEDFDCGIDLETAVDFSNGILDPLDRMAYYDGYIRRKYGLVDENGEEIFR